MLGAALWAQTPTAPSANPASQTPKPATGTAPGAASAPATTGGDPVVFTVGDESLTRSQFETLIASLPPNARQSIMQEGGRRKLAEQLVELKALAQEARKQKLDADPKVKSQLMLSQDNVLASMFFQNLVENATVTDLEAKKYYEEHRSEYEQAKARHILIRFKGSRVPLRPNEKDLTEEEALAKAKAIKERIAKGEDFAVVAKAESDDSQSGEQGGSLGTFGRGRMIPEFEKAAFTMPIGQVSDPVRTQFGYHLIQVEERTTTPFESVKADIEKAEKPEVAKKTADDLKAKMKVSLDEAYFGKAAAPAAPPSLMNPPGGAKPPAGPKPQAQ